MIKDALLSPCGEFRYTLGRTWDASLPVLVVCMLNPSTADASVDDPTILRLIHFAKAWGYGAILVVNEFAKRSSSPVGMDATWRGPDNMQHLNDACLVAKIKGKGLALAAWGNGTDGAMFRDAAERHRVRLVCLGTTRSGHPKHPLARGLHRIPNDQQPATWRHNPFA